MSQRPQAAKPTKSAKVQSRKDPPTSDSTEVIQANLNHNVTV